MLDPNLGGPCRGIDPVVDLGNGIHGGRRSGGDQVFLLEDLPEALFGEGPLWIFLAEDSEKLRGSKRRVL